MQSLREAFRLNASGGLSDLRRYFSLTRNRAIYTQEEWENPELIDAEVYSACSRRSCTNVHSCNCLAIKVQTLRKPGSGLWRTHAYITERLSYTQGACHFNKYVGSFTSPTSILLAAEYERPYYGGLRNLYECLEAYVLNEHSIKVVTYQLIVALAILQRRIVGACHNDTHTKNIVLVRNAERHVCRLRSASGKRFSHSAPFLVRIVDFELFTDLLGKASTPLGLHFFEKTLGNTMVDFMRFASRAITEIKSREWRSFVRRWLPSEMLEGKPNSMLSANALIPTAKAARYLNARYGVGQKSALLAMLDDPYFEDFAE